MKNSLVAKSSLPVLLNPYTPLGTIVAFMVGPVTPRSWRSSNVALILCRRVCLCLRLVFIYQGLSLAHCFQDGGCLASHVWAFTRILFMLLCGSGQDCGEVHHRDAAVFYHFLPISRQDRRCICVLGGK